MSERVLFLTRAREKFQTSAICHTILFIGLDLNSLSLCVVWQMFLVFLNVDKNSGFFA